MKHLVGGLLLGLCLAACTEQREPAPDPVNPDSSEVTVEIPPALAPNTARVRARLGEYRRTNDGLHGELAIDEVLATGSATRRPPVGSTLVARFGEGLAEDLEALAERLKARREPTHLTLRFQQGMALGSVPDWTIIAIHESDQ